MLNLTRKSIFLSKQYEKLVKNLIEIDKYSLDETFFLQTQYNKVFKNQELLYKYFKTKNVGIKTRYIPCHNPNFFFVINLAYVSIVNKEIFCFVP